MKKLCFPKPKIAILLSLLCIVGIALDRFVKWEILNNFDSGDIMEVVPGIVRLTYTQNTGGAFSAFSELSWLFYIFVPIAVIFLVYAMIAGFIGNATGIVSCVCVISGAIGNYIDRLVYGYVIDMIDFYCIRFAVFNVADCFITVGCIFLCISLFLPAEKPISKE